MVWGVDTATRITGITAGTGEGMPACGAWTFDYCGTDLGQLLEDFDTKLTELAGRCPPDVIMYESPLLLPGDRLLVIRKLYAMGAYLELFGRRTGAKVEEASAKALKKALTGNSSASKNDMVAVCRGLRVPLPAGEAAKDAADSFAAWYVGLIHHGKEHLPKWDQAILTRRGFLT